MFQQAMLGTQLNSLVANEEIVKNSIIKLNKYIINSVNQRKFDLNFGGVI